MPGTSNLGFFKNAVMTTGAAVATGSVITGLNAVASYALVSPAARQIANSVLAANPGNSLCELQAGHFKVAAGNTALAFGAANAALSFVSPPFALAVIALVLSPLAMCLERLVDHHLGRPPCTELVLSLICGVGTVLACLSLIAPTIFSWIYENRKLDTLLQQLFDNECTSSATDMWLHSNASISTFTGLPLAVAGFVIMGLFIVKIWSHQSSEENNHEEEEQPMIPAPGMG
jgi:hypothetical protein